MSSGSKYAFSQLNNRYLTVLRLHPLKTKAITIAIFNVFNEQLASLFAGDIQQLAFTIPGTKKKLIIPHTLTLKVPLMALYGLMINAPFSHYAYKLLNKLYKPPLTSSKKVGQIITAMLTITPILSLFMVSYISFINNAKFNVLYRLLCNGDIKNLRKELKILFDKILLTLKNSLLKVIESSWISSPIFMLIAQKWLEPNLWVGFFTICYFILGTYNNTRVKRLQLKKKQELEEQKRCK